LRPLFFLVFGRSYAALWDSFAVTSGTAREAILAGLGDDEHAFWASGERDARLHILPLVRTDSVVLDLGAGIGRIARAVAPHCRRVILVDASGVMLRRAREHLASMPNTEFVKTSGRSLSSIESASVDLAYSFLVLQHIEREDVIAYLDDLNRVLAPGAIFRFQIPNLSDPNQVAMYVRYATGTPTKSPGRMRYYTREELHILLPRLGFVIDSIESGESHIVTARRASSSTGETPK
jgi:ubiquinone/menaquinone biosynthesis C-methylase UbiE